MKNYEIIFVIIPLWIGLTYPCLIYFDVNFDSTYALCAGQYTYDNASFDCITNGYSLAQNQYKFNISIFEKFTQMNSSYVK